MPSRYDHLTHDELTRLLEARDRRDATRFGLVWEANEIERDQAINADFVALDLDAELSTPAAAPGGGWGNLIIEGDNFDALRYLRMTHAGRVKCIYIDPPYNTGNRDFVYNDRFVDANDSWRHSTWCEFMYQRLILAKDLLRQDGVIFVSIDDNEVFALGMLMNRIFGENHAVATFIWKRRTTPDSRNLNGVSGDHEYILAYEAGEGFRVRGRDKDLTKYSNPDNDPLGPWMSDNLTGLANASERPNLHYDLVNPETGIHYPPHASRGWVYGRDRMAELVANGRILWPKLASGRPRLKRYVTDMQSAVTGFSTMLDAPGNVEATKELGEMLGPKTFSFPKPSRLIAQLIEQATGPDDLVLDFFAGSGTTAHAVMKLNAEDGGKRRFILVSSTEATAAEPDKNLCRDVCAKRVRRVIEGYGDNAGLGGDFAYLRCRRIAPGHLLDIEHAQVWTALQMIHLETLEPCSPTCQSREIEGTEGNPTLANQATFLSAGDEGAKLIYVPRFAKDLAAALRDAVQDCAAAVIYSWQPETLRQHIRAGHVQHEAIPESLARRFGMKA